MAEAARAESNSDSDPAVMLEIKRLLAVLQTVASDVARIKSDVATIKGDLNALTIRTLSVESRLDNLESGAVDRNDRLDKIEEDIEHQAKYTRLSAVTLLDSEVSVSYWYREQLKMLNYNFKNILDIKLRDISEGEVLEIFTCGEVPVKVNMNLSNCTPYHPAEFIFAGFSKEKELHPLPFIILFSVYIFCLAGNLTLIFIIKAERKLHTPMYYFLCDLAVVDILMACSVTPSILVNFWSKTSTISFWGCLIQMCFQYLFAGVECYVLLVMAYDRYLAICHPLQYNSLMTHVLILKLLLVSWLVPTVYNVGLIFLVARLPFCASNVIKHEFCDHMSVATLATADISLNNIYAMVGTILIICLPFFLIVLSYIKIISAVLTIAQGEACAKVFSTCSTHLILVVVMFCNVIFVILVSRQSEFILSDLRISSSMSYLLFPGIFNPLIYAFRTKEIKQHIINLYRRNRLSPYNTSNIKVIS
nr:PREDICTED: olfactory receptor 52K1-like [Latimeria chalumnae]|eukprot:XP_014350707.1 PREDICTED: olfactory receptor 52K1-like [Latimeria chalumnae]